MRALFDITFAGPRRLPTSDAVALVNETIALARENWDVVGELALPELWAYKAAAKLLEDSHCHHT